MNPQERLTQLIATVYEVIRRVQANAPKEEIELRVNAARALVDELASTAGAGASGSFGTLTRHLYFLDYWYQRDEAERYAPDLVDIIERDLPGVVAAVTALAAEGFDTSLELAVATSWNASHYPGAVRDAFILLESTLREVGNVDPARGLSGDRLIEELLGSNSASALTLPAHGPFGTLTRGEQIGAYHLLRGAFLLARNATAHRPLDYSQQTAKDLIHLVNLCVNLIRPATPNR